MMHALDDPGRLSLLHAYRSHILWVNGESLRALEEARALTAAAARMKDKGLEVRARFQEGMVLTYRGDYAAGIPALSELLEHIVAGFAAGAYPDASMAVTAQSYLARAHAEIGNFDRARHYVILRLSWPTPWRTRFPSVRRAERRVSPSVAGRSAGCDRSPGTGARKVRSKLKRNTSCRCRPVSWVWRMSWPGKPTGPSCCWKMRYGRPTASGFAPATRTDWPRTLAPTWRQGEPMTHCAWPQRRAGSPPPRRGIRLGDRVVRLGGDRPASDAGGIERRPGLLAARARTCTNARACSDRTLLRPGTLGVVSRSRCTELSY